MPFLQKDKNQRQNSEERFSEIKSSLEMVTGYSGGKPDKIRLR
jgi:hypothetical protein